jgi:hypothetical protein
VSPVQEDQIGTGISIKPPEEYFGIVDDPETAKLVQIDEKFGITVKTLNEYLPAEPDMSSLKTERNPNSVMKTLGGVAFDAA